MDRKLNMNTKNEATYSRGVFLPMSQNPRGQESEFERQNPQYDEWYQGGSFQRDPSAGRIVQAQESTPVKPSASGQLQTHAGTSSVTQPPPQISMHIPQNEVPPSHLSSTAIPLSQSGINLSSAPSASNPPKLTVPGSACSSPQRSMLTAMTPLTSSPKLSGIQTFAKNSTPSSSPINKPEPLPKTSSLPSSLSLKPPVPGASLPHSVTGKHWVATTQGLIRPPSLHSSSASTKDILPEAQKASGQDHPRNGPSSSGDVTTNASKTENIRKQPGPVSTQASVSNLAVDSQTRWPEGMNPSGAECSHEFPHGYGYYPPDQHGHVPSLHSSSSNHHHSHQMHPNHSLHGAQPPVGGHPPPFGVPSSPARQLPSRPHGPEGGPSMVSIGPPGMRGIPPPHYPMAHGYHYPPDMGYSPSYHGMYRHYWGHHPGHGHRGPPGAMDLPPHYYDLPPPLGIPPHGPLPFEMQSYYHASMHATDALGPGMPLPMGMHGGPMMPVQMRHSRSRPLPKEPSSPPHTPWGSHPQHTAPRPAQIAVESEGPSEPRQRGRPKGSFKKEKGAASATATTKDISTTREKEKATKVTLKPSDLFNSVDKDNLANIFKGSPKPSSVLSMKIGGTPSAAVEGLKENKEQKDAPVGGEKKIPGTQQLPCGGAAHSPLLAPRVSMLPPDATFPQPQAASISSGLELPSKPTASASKQELNQDSGSVPVLSLTPTMQPQPQPQALPPRLPLSQQQLGEAPPVAAEYTPAPAGLDPFAIHHRHGTPGTESDSDLSPLDNSGDGKSKRKTHKKRFLWPEMLHRDFVFAILDTGLKSLSAQEMSVILEKWKGHSGFNLKTLEGHLKKMRIFRNYYKKAIQVKRHSVYKPSIIDRAAGQPPSEMSPLAKQRLHRTLESVGGTTAAVTRNLEAQHDFFDYMRGFTFFYQHQAHQVAAELQECMELIGASGDSQPQQHTPNSGRKRPRASAISPGEKGTGDNMSNDSDPSDQGGRQRRPSWSDSSHGKFSQDQPLISHRPHHPSPSLETEPSIRTSSGPDSAKKKKRSRNKSEGSEKAGQKSSSKKKQEKTAVPEMSPLSMNPSPPNPISLQQSWKQGMGVPLLPGRPIINQEAFQQKQQQTKKIGSTNKQSPSSVLIGEAKDAKASGDETSSTGKHEKESQSLGIPHWGIPTDPPGFINPVSFPLSGIDLHSQIPVLQSETNHLNVQMPQLGNLNQPLPVQQPGTGMNTIKNEEFSSQFHLDGGITQPTRSPLMPEGANQQGSSVKMEGLESHQAGLNRMAMSPLASNISNPASTHQQNGITDPSRCV